MMRDVSSLRPGRFTFNPDFPALMFSDITGGKKTNDKLSCIEQYLGVWRHVHRVIGIYTRGTKPRTQEEKENGICF